MPRLPFRAARGLVLILAVLLLAAPVHSTPPDARFDPRPVLFSAEPILNGQVVASCGGTSPLRNLCGDPVRNDDCADGCGPNVQPGLGFTGTITALVFGKGSDGSERHLAWSCSYTGGSQTTAFIVSTGRCGGSGNAEYLCLPECGLYLWPPFRLEGRAQPFQGVGPSGSWTAKVES